MNNDELATNRYGYGTISLASAVSQAGLTWEGQAHSAIADSRMTAGVVNAIAAYHLELLQEQARLRTIFRPSCQLRMKNPFHLTFSLCPEGATQSGREAHLLAELPQRRMEPVLTGLICVTLLMSAPVI